MSPAFQQNVPEGYIDLSSDEKLLAYWEKHCPPSDWAVANKGIEPPGDCAKCIGKDFDQVFGGTTPGRGTLISKARAEAIIKENRKRPHIIPNNLLEFLIFQNEFEEQHVVHVAQVKTPGIIACGGLKEADRTTLFCYLIDGTHRAVAAKRAGKPFQAYVLSFKETFECTLGPKKIADGHYRP